MTIRKQITSSFSAAVVLLWAWLLPFRADAQSLSLNDAIRIAQENSYSAQVARFSFMASYWTYRSFKAELLPSVNLNGGLMNFDHSLVSTRNYEDGRLAYVDNNTLSNNLALSLDQRIAATGGTVSLRSYLYRLDQFTYKEKTYNSQPLHISYSQPLKAFNQLKWDKKTAPVEYEIAQKTYISNMQTIALNVTTLFFNALTAQSNYQQSQSNVEDRERLYGIAKQRLDLGTVTKSDVLQMELSLLNARVAMNKNRIRLDDAMYDLFSYLRVTEYDEAELLPPFDVPDMLLELEEVIEKAIDNSAHTREQKLAMLNAEKELVKAKANQGLQVSLNGQLGFMQTGHTFSDAYNRLQDNEVVGLTLQLPIFDWGVSRGRVKMAKAKMEMVRSEQEQLHQDYIQDLRKKVMQFNSNPVQCQDAQRAQEISEERYEISRRRYEAGTISVTELNTAQSEMENAKSQYLTQLNTFWTDYYGLQKATLYDWIRKQDIAVDFEELVK